MNFNNTNYFKAVSASEAYEDK